MRVTKEQAQIINQCTIEMEIKEKQKREEVKAFKIRTDMEVGRLADELISNESTRALKVEQEKHLTYMNFQEFCKGAKITLAKVVKGFVNVHL